MRISWSEHRQIFVTELLPMYDQERCPFRKLGISRNLRRIRIKVVQIEVVGYQISSINCGRKHHYCREFRSINSFILRNWGACVDTIFGHVSRMAR